jgi:hypothetical protein
MGWEGGNRRNFVSIILRVQWLVTPSSAVQPPARAGVTRDLAMAAKFQSQNTETIAQAAKAQAVASIDQVDKLQALTKATKDAVEVNRQALESVQRAFVTFGPNLDTNVITDDANKVTAWEFRPKLENSGVTPTRNAIHGDYLNHAPSLW